MPADVPVSRCHRCSPCASSLQIKQSHARSYATFSRCVRSLAEGGGHGGYGEDGAVRRVAVKLLRMMSEACGIRVVVQRAFV
jgi:hypothetical protein